MGTRIGVMKVAAKRLGLTLQEYEARCAAGLKWCTGCKSWKPAGNFGIDRSRGAGRAARCTDCRRCGSGPGKGLRRRMQQAGLLWCRNCRKWKAEALVYAGLCRPCTNAADRARYAADLHYRLNRRQRVHARKRGVGPVAAEAQVFLLDVFGNKCAYCRAAEATTWDHIIPISQAGQTTPGNIVPACASCNSSKKDQDVWEWMGKRGLIPSDEFLGRYLLSECGLFG